MYKDPRSSRMRKFGIWQIIVFIAVIGLMAMPQSNLSAQSSLTGIDEDVVRFQEDEFQNLDARTGTLAPTAEQVNLVNSMGAKTRWNRFGTPRTLIKYGDFLATGLSGEPAVAVRNWIRTNRALFKLSDIDVTALELVHDIQLEDSNAHALLFRQRFGSYIPSKDGLIAVGYVDGKIAYVSSSTAPWDGAALGEPTIPAIAAWRIAAADVGRAAPLNSITNLRQEGSWTLMTVAGFSHPQRVRVRALPTPNNGVRVVYDTIVLQSAGADVLAATHLIDAQTGDVLVRENRMQHADEHGTGAEVLANRPTAEPEPSPFNGAFTETECGPAHEFAVAAGKTSINVVATADVPVNDIVLQLLFENALIASADTATSPEAVTYNPQGGVPVGNYQVKVCPFAGGVVAPPFTYSGVFTTDDSDVPNPLPYPPKWRFFEANPPLDHETVDTRVLRCWENDSRGTPYAGCDNTQRPLKVPGSNAVWDVNPRAASQSQFTTAGNNAQTAESWYSFLTPSAPVRPVSPEREYNFEWTNQWNEAQCSPTVFETPQRNDSNAATANLFALHNRMHDWSYSLGFTEEAYNLQDSNLGRESGDNAEGDPEIGNVQAGAVSGGPQSGYMGRDNANQVTLQDGVPGITNMYLWQPIAAAFYAPCTDGDYDMSIVGHEYGHAIQNRMVAGPDDGLGSSLGRSMGESWSDLTAIEYLNGYGLVPTDNENPFAVGPYATGSKQRGIRNYGMNYSPLNYSNVQYDGNGTTSPHADGEIWSAVNFRIRQALIQKYNAQFPASNIALQVQCADGRISAQACPGNRRWVQIFHDAFLLMQAGVTMDDARDAYLAADVMRFGGANQRELWREFARRGLGIDAFSVDGEDVDPVPSFASPMEPIANVTFNAVAADETGTPAVDAQIFVGQYEARSVPIADTNPTTPISLSNGTIASRTARMMAGTYEFIAQAPGYGAYRFTHTVTAGASTVVVPMPTNWASGAKGATITGNGAANDKNLDKLIDDTEETNWARLSTNPISQTHVTIDLGGGPRTVNRINVSAVNRPANASDPGGDTGGQGRFSALRQFAIYTCLASAANNNCADDSGFQLAYTSPEDAFPGAAPRPTVADLNMRGFRIAPTQATHVRMQVLTNQCTGGPDFQGEQDADPFDRTDCDSGTVQGQPTTADNMVRAAELQVFAGAEDIRHDNFIVLPLIGVEY